MDPEDTSIQLDALAYVPFASRSDPQLHWSVGKRSHTYVIGGRTVIGTAEGNDVVAQVPGVSRLHAALEPTEDGVWIRDLGSKNGTFVGGIRVAHARVPDEGRIQLGSLEMVLHYHLQASEVELWPSDRFGPLLGRSVIMRELFARLSRVARTESTVLIEGETGTGKELVARAIHEASSRKDKAYVVVDCGALPENLLEAELFGHTKGAFTGAASARAGAIEAADGGTVFLDEIGEMPVAMQPKLLRALESRMVRRLGETSYRQVDVRIVSATHRDLASMVNSGAFREDLYFRLAVVPIVVPPLRARTEDIPLLAESFLTPGTQGGLGPELMRELTSRPWLGNVRELRNFVHRAMALGAREALAIGRPSAQPPQAKATNGADGFPAVSIDEPFKDVRDRLLDHLEREYMRAMLERHNRDTGAIAQAAGLDRSYIYRLMRKHDL